MRHVATGKKNVPGSKSLIYTKDLDKEKDIHCIPFYMAQLL